MYEDGNLIHVTDEEAEEAGLTIYEPADDDWNEGPFEALMYVDPEEL